ncbi:hypothetical protein FWF93_00405 [Candidatus Saccharibacteria bacterium]|nr:hypothetical protein [Candidatus Saccharibacteria bacterium]
MKIKEAFKLAMRTRSFWLMSVIMLILVAITIIITLGSLRVTSINIPIHYSDYANNFFNDKWYYLVAFIAFTVAVFVINLFLIAKMIAADKRPLAVVVQFVTILILFITLMILLNIYGIIKLKLAI